MPISFTQLTENQQAPKVKKDKITAVKRLFHTHF